jgi:hypothetical protein
MGLAVPYTPTTQTPVASLSTFRPRSVLKLRSQCQFMGVHSIGQVLHTSSGFVGNSGWDYNKNRLDNNCNANGAGTTLNESINNAPGWNRQMIDNAQVPSRSS